MKIKLPEHDHKLTNLLKVILFSLLMLLPFLDIGTRCGYVLLNKNAYQSYYGETINDSEIKYYNYDEINNGELYTINLENLTYRGETSTRSDLYFNIKLNDNFNNLEKDTNYILGFNVYSTYTLYIFSYTVGGTGLLTLNSSTDTASFKAYILQKINNYNFDFFNNTAISQITYNSYSYLDNVFDYSIDKMANSPLYNWTTQTGMYTGVNAMTTGLGITTPLFAILITYWMFLTIIYIILDIVLSLFTFMTHIFTKKE